MKTFAVFFVVVAAAIAGPVNNFNWKNIVEIDSMPKGIPRVQGSVKPEIEGRITGGMIAAPHQFPYQVGLYVNVLQPNEQSVTAWCGASLISKRVVLTAAHCLQSGVEAIVFLGTHNIQEDSVGKVLMRVDASHFIIHEHYDPVTATNDIALVVLPEEAPINKYIQTIDLPNPSEDEHYLEGKLALISGWGITADDEDMSMDLRYVSLRILPAYYCKKTYYGNFHSTQICVSGENRKSACSGDSGGPLVVPGPTGKKTVIGLTSFGRLEGCQKGFPAVFTRITSYLDWIENKVGVKPKNY